MTIKWSDGPENGGATILHYSIFYDNGNGDGLFVLLASEVASQEYVATSLDQGSTYQFRVKAQNIFGLSEYSDTLTTLSAFIPDAPTLPRATIDGSNVIVTWEEPDNGGSPITAYIVKLSDSTSSFRTELTSCDGSSQVIIDSQSCTISLDILTAAPFNLALGDPIQVVI